MTPATRLANPMAINNDPHSIISRGPRGFQKASTPKTEIKNAETKRENQPTASRLIPVNADSHSAGYGIGPVSQPTVAIENRGQIFKIDKIDCKRGGVCSI